MNLYLTNLLNCYITFFTLIISKNSQMPQIMYSTNLGNAIHGEIEELQKSGILEKYLGQVDLIFTSPPFPLNRKKAYGNKENDEYLNWLTGIFQELMKFLKPTGSLVIEIGNAWNKGEPTISTLPLKTLIKIQEECELKLCQTFIWSNTARLPSPAQWVTVKRIRVKDSYTNIWWMSKSSEPNANNRNILKEYSSSMKKLLQSQKYNSGIRPSEHHINPTSFLKANEGSIPGNVISGPNTTINSAYKKHCKDNGLKMHPATMPEYLPEFFIKFLTEEGDLVLDPFAGSNTTGAVAERLNRRWIAIETELEYIEGSKGRFM